MTASFFSPKKNVKISQIFKDIPLKKDFKINKIKPLHNASSLDLTFFDNIKYKSIALKTNGGADNLID